MCIWSKGKEGKFVPFQKLNYDTDKANCFTSATYIIISSWEETFHKLYDSVIPSWATDYRGLKYITADVVQFWNAAKNFSGDKTQHINLGGAF